MTTTSELRESRRAGDRRHASTSEVVSIIVLILQFAGLVWGASSLKSAVDGLQSAVSAMTTSIERLDARTNAINVDVGILKDRVIVPRVTPTRP